MNNNNQNSGFMSGFILGVLVGAVLVFLFATKKGKKLLKLLSEEGLEGVAELEELIAENFAEEEVPVSRKVDKVVPQKVVHEQKSRQKDDQPLAGNGLSSVPLAISRFGTSRRFFRGIPKR